MSGLPVTREVVKKIISAFHAYYDVNLEDPIPPFVAEAVFRLHDERYVMTRKAKIAEVDSNEFVYFADAGEILTKDKYLELDEIAWNDGLNRTKPRANHRNSDVTVVIVAGEVDTDCINAIKKAKHYVSYKFSFHGWSVYRAVVYDLSKKTIIYNRRGRELKNVFDPIEVF